MIRILLYLILGIDVFLPWDEESIRITHWVKNINGFWIVNSINENEAENFDDLEERGVYGPFPSRSEATEFADTLNKINKEVTGDKNERTN